MPETDDVAEGLADTIGVADAMRRVLAAEREADEAIARCRQECQAELESARLEAHRIIERAEQLAQAIHGRTERIATQRAAQHRADLAEQPVTVNAEVFAAAIARLAERLTGREL